MATTKRDGIASFLSRRVAESPFLIPQWSPELETQVNVHEGSTLAAGDEDKVWTDGEQVWSAFRWPHKAGSDPYYKDEPLTFSPGEHVSRIGSTWWNWVKKRSVAVTFDIDVEGAGHAASTNMVNEDRLAEIVEALKAVGYITLVRSTGGKGVHAYAFFNPADQPVTKNHHEHTAVGKAVVAKVSKDTGIDFVGDKLIDVQGVVIWLWADSSPADHSGFSLIHEARYQIGASDIPDWQTVELASNNGPVKIEGFTDTGAKVVNTVDGEFEIHPLDEDHKEILRELETLGWTFTWIDKYNQARTHTSALKALHEKRKAEGRPLKGLFETITSNSGGKTKPNCYIAPRPNGAFRVARFGNAVSEHGLWERHEDDCWIYFNQETNVLGILRNYAASYDGNKLVFSAKRLDEALHVLESSLVGADDIKVAITVVLQNDGRFIARIPKEEGGDKPEGWKSDKKGYSLELGVVHVETVFRRCRLEEADKLCRSLVTPQNEHFGWALKTERGWVVHRAYGECSAAVTQRFGKDSNDVKADMSTSPWRLAHMPFQKEYPGGRDWNKDAPQLAFEPSSVAGSHPHFDMILEHLGASLDSACRKTEWCSKWGIQTGADYLRFWIASLIKEPDQPLPYLFFFGPQNSGKSIFFETLDLLFTCGVVNAGGALTGSFNAELGSCVVGYIDEKDLSSARDGIYTKIKEWITARQIQIHKKGHTPYQQPNTIHMCHCANSHEFLTIDSGDTKIVAVEVNPIKDLIPKAIMERRLREEAPYFLRTVLLTQLPEPIDRLRVPPLTSDAKTELERMNMKPVEAFAADSLKPCPGSVVSLKDFYEAYLTHCQGNGREAESQIAVSRQLRVRSDIFTIGRYKGNQTYIANVTMDMTAKIGEMLVLNDKDRLVPVSEAQ